MMNKWADYLDDLRAGKVIVFELVKEPDNDFALFQKLKEQGLIDEILAKLK